MQIVGFQVTGGYLFPCKAYGHHNKGNADHKSRRLSGHRKPRVSVQFAFHRGLLDQSGHGVTDQSRHIEAN